jgi:hypothetical protein
MKAATACLLVSVLALAAGCAAPGSPPPVVPPPPSGRSAVEERIGIRVVAIRSSADGFMLDFRYRVVEPDRALLVMDRSIKPYVIDEASGARFVIPSSPKVGPMRQTTRYPESGRVYWLLFANPARFIKPGNLVTVVIGDFRLEHLVVE